MIDGGVQFQRTQSKAFWTLWGFQIRTTADIRRLRPIFAGDKHRMKTDVAIARTQLFVG